MFELPSLIDVLYSLPAVLLAFTFHEYAHASVAYHLGDPTPKQQGRLTLVPWAHIDWIGFIMFIIFGYGWAKPVQINPSNFKNRKMGDILVSVAGPIANVILSFFALLIYKVVIVVAVSSGGPNLSNNMFIILGILHQVVVLNIVFTFLNLIPIPPLDGYRIVRAIFFRKNIKFFWTIEKYGAIIFFAMLLTGAWSFLINIPLKHTYSLLSLVTDFIVKATAFIVGVFS